MHVGIGGLPCRPQILWIRAVAVCARRHNTHDDANRTLCLTKNAKLCQFKVVFPCAPWSVLLSLSSTPRACRVGNVSALFYCSHSWNEPRQLGRGE